MAQIIARIYADASSAASAVKDVKALGYGDSELFVCAPSAGATKADLATALGQAGFGKDEAEACADEVLKGRTAVAVHAAFGGGAKVTAALDRFGPIAAPPTKPAAPKTVAKPRSRLFTGEVKHEGFSTGEVKLDDPTPLSSYFKWPTLINSPTLFSDYFKFPVLSAFKSNIELSDDPAPLSKKFGWEVLKNDPTPLSTKFNWPVLRD